MSLFENEKTLESDGSHLGDDVRVDDGAFNKIDTLEVGKNFDFDKEFAEIERLALEAKKGTTFWQKLSSFEFELDFENKNNMVVLLGAFAAAAGILCGLDQSIISGASLGMDKALHLDARKASLVASLMQVGAMTGSIIMTPLNEYFGRKLSIMISCVWYTVGSALCAGAVNHNMMYVGRYFLGIGIGLEGGCVGIYISESVPAHVRGSLVSMYQFNIALGEVLGFAIGAIFFDVKGGWRYMVGSSLVFSTALLVGLFFLPESPRFLMYKGKVGESYNVWRRLRDINVPENRLEFLEMRQAAEHDQQESLAVSTKRMFRELFTIPRNRRALVYAIIMVTLGQMTGINAVMYNMGGLLRRIGFDDKRSVIMSIVGGAALWIGTIPAILYMDRFGRRLWGMNIFGFFIGLLLVGIGYLIDVDTHLQAAQGVFLSGIIIYMFFFGAYACLTWVLPAESFSISTRSLGLTISSTILYLFSFTVTYNFNEMQERMTYTGLTFGFYGGIAFVGVIYQLIFMPETKDKTLEEIDDIFSKPTWDIGKENIRNMKRFCGF